MKVVHVHISDGTGGGSKIAYNLHQRLRDDHSVESRMYVRDAVRDDGDVRELRVIPGEKYLTYAVERVLSLDGLGSPSSFRLQRIVRDDVDLIHLHNIHGGFYNLLNVPLLPEDVPLVWTCHDMWPFTGNCPMSYGCRRFEKSCGHCPELDSYPPLTFDTTRLLRALKQRLFTRRAMHLAAPSRWMMDQLSASFLADKPRTLVPNGVDTERFAPTDTIESRERFGLDPNATVVLLVNPSKGIADLFQALGTGSDDPVTVLVAGEGRIPADLVPDRVDVVHPGNLAQPEMVAAYGAVDVTVVPSRGESFGLVATESMSCGTPVVAYDVGGLSEQMTDDVGWTVPVGDVAALGEAIRHALADADERRRRGENGRVRVRENYEVTDMVEGYRRLYRLMLGVDAGDGTSTPGC